MQVITGACPDAPDPVVRLRTGPVRLMKDGLRPHEIVRIEIKIGCIVAVVGNNVPFYMSV